MEEELKRNIKKTGTTTVGLICKDGVVLAADKRATAGYLIVHKKTDKIQNITDNIAVTTAGVVSDIQLVTKLTKAELNLRKIRTGIEPTVKETASLFSTILYHNIRKFSPIMSIAAFLIGGVDAKGFWLYEASPDGAVTDYDDYVSSGSGSIVAYGVLESLYKEDMNVKEGVKLAVRAINAAMQRDIASGSGVSVVTITKEGINKVFEEEVKEVITTN